MNLGTPGPHYFGDLFVKLGTPYRMRMRVPHGYSIYSATVKKFHRFRAYLIHTRGWPVPVCSFIKLLQMATSQTGSTADVDACSDNELVEVENHKNEARFKSADGNLYYVGGGKLTSCLNTSLSLFSVVFHSACSKT